MKKEDAQIIADAINNAFNTPRSNHEMAYLEALAVALAGEGLSSPVGREISNVTEAAAEIGRSLDYIGAALHRIAEVMEKGE